MLYDLARRYGHISTMTAPTPQPAGTPRFSTLTFSRLRSSVTAVSCLHGISVPVGEDAKPGVEEGPKTTLKFSYESPIKAHAVQDWISSHPRIALPVLAFLLGTFSCVLATMDRLATYLDLLTFGDPSLPLISQVHRL